MKQPRHSAAFVAVVLGVALAHLLLADQMAARLEWPGNAAPVPPRLQASFVRTLQLAKTASPAAKPAANHPARPRRASPAAAGASAAPVASTASPASPPQDSERVAAVEPSASAPASPDAAASAVEARLAEAASAPASAASQPAEGFAWPASTRISYLLTGYVRGEVNGSAQVEWLRAGPRYQVHIDVVVGPRFAPLMSRRMSSDGEITPAGLAPLHYDQETTVAFGTPHRLTMSFDDDSVRLANGTRVPRPPGLQDTASQFVQLTYEFRVRPQSLSAGQRITLPLALPRYVEPWVYEVLGEETLHTRFGAVPAFHLKPTRAARPGGDLVAEAWFAPRLEYLPVRIRISQDEATWLDLTIDQLPEQAER